MRAGHGGDGGRANQELHSGGAQPPAVSGWRRPLWAAAVPGQGMACPDLSNSWMRIAFLYPRLPCRQATFLPARPPPDALQYCPNAGLQ